jgi:hypothetical protein
MTILPLCFIKKPLFRYTPGVSHREYSIIEREVKNYFGGR